jgi:hypothetical protein
LLHIPLLRPLPVELCPELSTPEPSSKQRLHSLSFTAGEAPRPTRPRNSFFWLWISRYACFQLSQEPAALNILRSYQEWNSLVLLRENIYRSLSKVQLG